MKKALLVGINRYPDPRNELKGCINDVRMMEATLRERFGFVDAGNTRILVDARATTKAILGGLSWLTEGSAPGDSLVFHYSGHGSQVPDRHGDESDRQDEILCPYDLDWNRPLTDDDLASACASIPEGVLFTVILDCCHSGTGLREFDGHGWPSAEAGREAPDPIASAAAVIRPRFLPHPDGPQTDPSHTLPRRWPWTAKCRGRQGGPGFSRLGRWPWTAKCRGRQGGPGFSRLGRFGVSITRSKAVLIAACRDDQTSADAFIDGGYHGAHTYHLCRALRGPGGIPTYRGLIAATGTALSRAGFDQVPQLEGPARLLAMPAMGNHVQRTDLTHLFLDRSVRFR